jgi:GT2 family glycosyltransferase
MLRRTVDLLKKGRVGAEARDLSKESLLQSGCRVSAVIGGRALRGWYRFKVVSPQESLQRVGIEAFDKGGSTIFASESISRSERFAGYIFLDAPVTSLALRLDFDAMPRPTAIAKLRPISLLEYVWHSLRRGFQRQPVAFVGYFFRPPDPFILRFEFPRPPRFANQDELYMWWIAEREASAQRRLVAAWPVPTCERPTISIIMTVCDPHPVYLRKAVESVLRQTADNWQLCIADDASTNPAIGRMLSNAAQSDSRIKVLFRKSRGGISAASNTALSLASAPFIMCLDHDDMLAPCAVEAITSFISRSPSVKLVYSDEDKIDRNDRRFQPYFKPQFSRELLYSSNYINHLTALHSETVRQAGGWRGEFDGAHDYDLYLRMVESIDESQIGHIPMILYHWRAIAGSAALDIGFKPYAIGAGQRAVKEHLVKRRVKAQVDLVADTMYRVRYELPEPQPPVSIIIPFRDKAELLRQCVSSIRAKTTYRNYEIVLVDNGSVEPATLDLLESHRHDDRVHVLHEPGPFNFSALNNRAADYSKSEYLCLLNNDTEVIAPGWLEDMIGYASQRGVGCVGAKLYYVNGGVQHAGVVLGLGGVAGHVFLNRPSDDPGYFGRLLVASNYSAVTAACLVVRRSIYMEVGGLDEKELPVAYNDIDFCIRVKLHGYRNVMTPFAELFHRESASRGSDETPERATRLEREVQVMKRRYGAALELDPCYSPHLTLQMGDFSLRLD